MGYRGGVYWMGYRGRDAGGATGGGMLDGLPGEYVGWATGGVCWMGYRGSMLEGLPGEYVGWATGGVCWIG